MTEPEDETAVRLRDAVDVAFGAWASMRTALDAYRDYCTQRGRVAAVESLIGQDGDLLFAVRVKGLGARPDSPQSIARVLCAEWSGLHHELTVELNDASLVDERQKLDALSKPVVRCTCLGGKPVIDMAGQELHEPGCSVSQDALSKPKGASDE